MAEPVSIKERIERQQVADLAAGLSLPPDRVQRLEEENDAPIAEAGADRGVVPEAWLMVDAEDEEELPGEDERAALGYETVDLPFVVHVHLTNKPQGVSLAQWANGYIAGVKAAIMGNPQVVETATGQGLALNSWVDRTFAPIRGDRPGEYVCGVEGRRRYRHPEGDPYAL